MRRRSAATSKIMPLIQGMGVLCAIGAAAGWVALSDPIKVTIDTRGPAAPELENSWTTVKQTYAFTADNLYEAHVNMFQRSPIKIDGESYGGQAQSTWNWHVEQEVSRKSGCKVANVVIQGTSMITLPDWQNLDDAPMAAQREWQRYMDALIEHEERHVEISRDASEDMIAEALRLPPAATCDALMEQMDVISTRHARRSDTENLRFDRRTDHGATDGAQLKVPKGLIPKSQPSRRY